MTNPNRLSRRHFLQVLGLPAGAALLGRSVLERLAPAPAQHRLLQGGEPPRFERNKVTVNTTTLGHVDHGKTTLTAAITNVLALRGRAEARTYEEIADAPESLIDAIPFNISLVDYETDGRYYLQADCPAHRDYIKNLIAGSTRSDGAILVVSAVDGPMPQSREHILLARQAGIQAIVVFLNKTDQMDDPELLELVELEIRELLGSYGYRSDSPIVRGSALQAYESGSRDVNAPEYAPILQLMDVVDTWIPAPVPSSTMPFLMPIEDVFSIKGRGTVVTGRVERGTLTKGEEIAIIGLRDDVRTSVVTGIEMFSKELDAATAGDNAGVLLRGIEREDIERGMVLAAPNSIGAHKIFMSEVYVLQKEEGGRQKAFFTGYRPQFYMRTTDVTGTITLPDGVEMVMPGDNVNVTVELIAPMALEIGSKFAIREGGLTVGFGIITEILD